MLLANLATLATALFTGAAVYISLLEHPARLPCLRLMPWDNGGPATSERP